VSSVAAISADALRDTFRRRQHTRQQLAGAGWAVWLHALFPAYVTRGFAPYHAEFWEWVTALRPGVRARPFMGLWPRGYAKSTSAELAVAMIAAQESRRYALYICETQEQADDHVQNIAGMLESRRFANLYPSAASRRISKYGTSKGWRRNRLRTASGFTIDAIGLDTAARGVKLDEDRPDLLLLDDLDGKFDSAATTQKKLDTLTHTLLPATSDAPAVLFIQNLVIPDGIAARLADGRAEFLSDRIVSGPHPAVEGLETEQRDGRTVVTRGTPTWPAMGLDVVQAEIDAMGITAYRAEKQHEVEPPPGGMFDGLEFKRCSWKEVPDLVRVVVWVDPAVTATDQSDAQGIQADGISEDGEIYRLYSWEAITSPEDVLRRAILKAVELKAEKVGVETDQGGDTWKTTYRAVVDDLIAEGLITREQVPQFDEAKAGQGYGPKVARAGQMLVDYERDQIRHVRGTHDVLERALRRFPRTKPFDLVDASFWSWHDLRENAPISIAAPVAVEGTTFFSGTDDPYGGSANWDAGSWSWGEGS
jgi:hypothetical protein